MKEILKKAVVLLITGALIFGTSVFFNAFADTEIPPDNPTGATDEQETPPVSETTDPVTDPPTDPVTDPPTEPPTEPTTDPVTFEEGSEYEIVTNLNEREDFITRAGSKTEPSGEKVSGSGRTGESGKPSQNTPQEVTEEESAETAEEITLKETALFSDETDEPDTGKRLGTGKIIAIIVLAAAVIAAAALIVVLKKID